MKSSFMCSMIAVAALTVAAGSVSAQTLTAQIPMSFHVGAASLPAGNYQVRVVTGSTATAIISIYNLDAHRGTLVMPPTKADTPKAWLRDGTPRLSFSCAGETCNLAGMWTGEGTSEFRFHNRELPTVEAHGMTVVTLAMVKVR